MAGVMGYAAVVDVAHDMEALLASVRGGTRPLDAGGAALLLESADVLEAAIDAAVGGAADTVDVTAICERLRGAVRMDAADAATPSLHSRTLSLPPDDGLAVLVRLTSGAPLPGARALLVVNRARSLGEVTAIVPSEQELVAEHFDSAFALRLRSDASDDAITSAMLAAGFVESVTVQRGLAPAPAAAGVRSASERADVAWSAGSLKGALQRYVRIDLHRLDTMMNLVGELVIARGRLARLVDAYPDPDLQDAAASMASLVAELQDGVLASRMVPVWQVFDRFPRVVRDAARVLDKEIDFVVDGREIELDRSLLEQIGDPLVHLLRNAIDHGIETPAERVAAGKPRSGRLVLSASRDRAAVVIRVTDDGKGIDRRALLEAPAAGRAG